MKKHIIILLITFLCLPEYLEAQLKYYDAAEFPLYGKSHKEYRKSLRTIAGFIKACLS